MDILAEPELKPSQIDVVLDIFFVALDGISGFFKVSNILKNLVWLGIFFTKKQVWLLLGFGSHHSNILTAQFSYRGPRSVLL